MHTCTHARTHARTHAYCGTPGHRVRGNTHMPDAIARHPAVRIVKKGYYPYRDPELPALRLRAADGAGLARRAGRERTGGHEGEARAQHTSPALRGLAASGGAACGTRRLRKRTQLARSASTGGGRKRETWRRAAQRIPPPRNDRRTIRRAESRGRAQAQQCCAEHGMRLAPHSVNRNWTSTTVVLCC
jgi:hypothetical protein